MNYYVIGDEDTVLGFGMVGVEGTTADSKSEIYNAFTQIIEENIYGIILITERCAEKIRREVNRYILTEQFPLIMEIPDRNGPIPGKPDLKTIVDKSNGINL